MKEERFEEAERAFLFTLRLNPYHNPARMSLIKLYELQGRFSEAAREWNALQILDIQQSLKTQNSDEIANDIHICSQEVQQNNTLKIKEVDIESIAKEFYNKDKRHIEELVDRVKAMKNDVWEFYRYGIPGSTVDFFKSLTLRDKKRFVCVGLIEKDPEIKKLLNFLVRKYFPIRLDLKHILDSLREDDREEIELLIKNKSINQEAFSEYNLKRIKIELAKACKKIGYEKVEKAYWILLPEKQEEALWIKATNIETPLAVVFNPPNEIKWALIFLMRQALRILHVHNHPEPGVCAPSSQDIWFKSFWKNIRPELSWKFNFYVVQKETTLSY
ncbi:MAG: hypothetical protein ACTSU6_07335 [Candidatus Njordarchaeales archaeon]